MQSIASAQNHCPMFPDKDPRTVDHHYLHECYTIEHMQKHALLECHWLPAHGERKIVFHKAMPLLHHGHEHGTELVHGHHIVIMLQHYDNFDPLVLWFSFYNTNYQQKDILRQHLYNV